MARMKYDVLVLGGGPAGCVTAMELAARGLSAAVLERSGYAKPKLGESIAPNMRVWLERAGVWERFAADGHIRTSGIQNAWGYDELQENNFIFNPYGNGWQIDRAKFDLMLADEAERRGVALFRRARNAAVKMSGGNWQAEFTEGECSYAVTARFFVNAAGRGSRLGRGLGGGYAAYDSLTAAARWFLPRNGMPAAAFGLMVEGAEDGWWYATPLPDGRLLAVFLSDFDLLRSAMRQDPLWWDRRAAQTRHISRLIAQVSPVGVKPRLFRANTQRFHTISPGNWLAVGDAAAGVDPLSSQGIMFAFKTAFAASEAIIRYFSSNQPDAVTDYFAALDGLFGGYREKQIHYYGMERRWPQSRFWARRYSQRCS